MKKAVDVVASELKGIRAGRATPALVEHLEVKAYDQAMRLQELAAITTPDPRSILIKPYDKNILPAIEKAIQVSDINLPPNVQGDTIRLNIPPLTEERREELVKVAHREVESGRIAVRNIRRDGKEKLDQAKKKKEITEDEHRKLLDELQQMTDRFTGEMEELLARKEKEIRTV